MLLLLWYVDVTAGYFDSASEECHIDGDRCSQLAAPRHQVSKQRGLLGHCGRCQSSHEQHRHVCWMLDLDLRLCCFATLQSVHGCWAFAWGNCLSQSTQCPSCMMCCCKQFSVCPDYIALHHLLSYIIYPAFCLRHAPSCSAMSSILGSGWLHIVVSSSIRSGFTLKSTLPFPNLRYLVGHTTTCTSIKLHISIWTCMILSLVTLHPLEVTSSICCNIQVLSYVTMLLAAS